MCNVALIGVAISMASMVAQQQAANKSAKAVQRVQNDALGFVKGQRDQANQASDKIIPQFGADGTIKGAAPAGGAEIGKDNSGAADVTKNFSANGSPGGAGGGDAFKSAITSGATAAGDQLSARGSAIADRAGFSNSLSSQNRTLADMGDFNRTQSTNREIYMSRMPANIAQAAQAGHGLATLGQLGSVVGSGMTTSSQWSGGGGTTGTTLQGADQGPDMQVPYDPSSGMTYDQWLRQNSGRRVQGSIRPTTTVPT